MDLDSFVLGFHDSMKNEWHFVLQTWPLEKCRSGNKTRLIFSATEHKTCTPFQWYAEEIGWEARTLCGGTTPAGLSAPRLLLAFLGCSKSCRRETKLLGRKHNPTSSPPTYPPFPPAAFFFFFLSRNNQRTCTASAVNNSVPPKVNFQFAQRRVAITLWPANCISPLIPYHLISGSLCSLEWGPAIFGSDHLFII